mgnify:FL=1
MAFQKITESESLYDNLDQMSVRELLEGINNEDRKVAIAVGREIPKIEKLVTRIVERMRRGGRLFYIGAGTSGRLGVLDASEIPPTYGMPNTLVIGLIAGGAGRSGIPWSRRKTIWIRLGRNFNNIISIRTTPWWG